jgi:uncharacterized membrane protein
MSYGIAYVACLILFGVVDGFWISTMANRLYRPMLGDILLANLRLAPALAFYFLFPVGLLVFAVGPSLRTESWTTAVCYGLIFGAFTYGTYDLTNYATLRNWTLQITIIDISYGAIVAAGASFAGYWAAKTFSHGA